MRGLLIKLFMLFCLSLLGVFYVNGAAPASISAKRNIESRIIGGQLASAGQFKFVAAIYVQTDNSRHFCGGALTGNKYIITSGHCVYNGVLFTIQLGSIYLNTEDENRVTVATSTYHLHPDFDPLTSDNDIAIIELRMAVMLNGYIQPIWTSSTHHEDTSVVALGFGQTSDSDPELSEQLRYVDVTTLSNNECRIIYGNQITENMVCVSGNYNEGACTGDTGGPLIYREPMAKSYLLAGVASFISGNGCEGTDPSGYTRVRPYIDWINVVTGRYNSTAY